MPDRRAEGSVPTPEAQPVTAVPSKAVNLALQGGGSHGAFTWGVLDALLEDGRLEFEGVSGTSAGAMNAVVLAHALAKARQAGHAGSTISPRLRHLMLRR